MPWRGSPTPQSVLHWQDSHTSGIPAEVAGGGEAVLCPGSCPSPVTVLGALFLPAGVCWRLGGVLLVCVPMMLLAGREGCGVNVAPALPPLPRCGASSPG